MSANKQEVVCVPVNTVVDIAQVVILAQRIWTQHYVPIIGQAQVEYMLERIQSPAAIARQIAEGHEYFLVVDRLSVADPANCPALGYMDIVNQPQTNKLFISKLYMLAESRGCGLGRAMFDHAVQFARQRGLTDVYLTVNKLNPSLQIYLHWGMVNCGSVVKDIGNGFVMDDFRLELAV